MENYYFTLLSAVILPIISLIAFAFNCGMGAIAVYMAKKRGLRTVPAFFLGFFMSFVALFIVALIPKLIPPTPFTETPAGERQVQERLKTLE